VNEKLLEQLGDGEDAGAKRHGSRIRKAFVGRLSGREEARIAPVLKEAERAYAAFAKAKAVLGVTHWRKFMGGLPDVNSSTRRSSESVEVNSTGFAYNATCPHIITIGPRRVNRLSLTAETPGVDSAATRIAFRSASDRVIPQRSTTPPLTVTFRRNVSSHPCAFKSASSLSRMAASESGISGPLRALTTA
jgi:hypothetical protein